MTKADQPHVADLMAMYKATFLELPLAGMKWGLGMGKEEEAVKAAWSGYDAWVRVTSAGIDSTYRNSLFGSTITRLLGHALRWQRLGQAVVSVVSGSLLPTMGLPTAAAVNATHDEVQSLTAQFKVQDAHLRALRAEVHRLANTRTTSAVPPQRTKPTPTVRRNAPLPLTPASSVEDRTAFAPATAA